MDHTDSKHLEAARLKDVYLAICLLERILEQALAIPEHAEPLFTQRKRPYVRYFRRAVRMIIMRNRTWVLQTTVQRLVSLMTLGHGSSEDDFDIISAHFSSQLAQAQTRTREDVVAYLEGEQSYWEKISAAHRHAGKIRFPPGISRTPCPQPEKKHIMFPTLERHSTRCWPAKVKAEFGVRSRSSTLESFRGLGERYNSYLEMLLLEQERSSAQSRPQPDEAASRRRVKRKAIFHGPKEEAKRRNEKVLGKVTKDTSKKGWGALLPRKTLQQQSVRTSIFELELEEIDTLCSDSDDSGAVGSCEDPFPVPDGFGVYPELADGSPRPGTSPPSIRVNGPPDATTPRGSAVPGVALQGLDMSNESSPISRLSELPCLSQMIQNTAVAAMESHPSSPMGFSAGRGSSPVRHRSITDTLSQTSAPPASARASRSRGEPSSTELLPSRPSTQASAARQALEATKRGLGDAGSVLPPLWNRMPPPMQLVGSPLRRPGVARVAFEANGDRILSEHGQDGVDAREPEEIESLAEVQYFRACNDLSILPTKKEFLTRENIDEIDLASALITDKEAQALSEAISQGRSRLEVVDLSGNPLLTDASLRHTLQSLAPLAGHLRILRLGGIRPGRHAMEALAETLATTAHLEEVSMKGAEFQESAWAPFCRGLVSAATCVKLDLADTCCGRWQQHSCVQVAEMLARIPTLREVDLSANYFRQQGLEALGSAASMPGFCITALALDDNAWADAITPEQHPMAGFLELLRHNRTLTRLCLQRSHLDRIGAICLEDTVLNHPHMFELRLGGNPFGEDGIRSVMRALLSQKSNLEVLDVVGFRRAIDRDAAVTFNFGDLTESYTDSAALNLEYPYHRSVLRLMLRRTEDVRASPAECLKNYRFDGRRISPNFSKDAAGLWQVPSSGRAEFDLVLPMPDAAGLGASAMLRSFCQARRMPVIVTKFVVLLQTFANLQSDQERMSLIGALAKDFSLKLGHLKLMIESVMEHMPHLTEKVLPRLILAIPDMDLGCILAASTPRDLSDPACRKLRNVNFAAMRVLLWFNPSNANGHYQLDLESPMEYTVAERVFTVNSWESECARRARRPDTSMYGQHNAVRNFKVGKQEQRHKMDWEMPGDGFVGVGKLSFDYTRLLFASPSIRPLGPVLFDTLMAALTRPSTAEGELNVLLALRMVSHKAVFTARQLGTMLKALKDHSQSLEVYCLLFTQCCDFGPPLVDNNRGILGDSPGWSIFTYDERMRITERLGLANTLDWMHVHIDDGATNVSELPKPMTPSSRRGSGGPRGVVFADNKERRSSRKDDRDRVKGASDRKDGEDRRPRNRYKFNLEYNDEHVCATLLLFLADTEDGINIIDPSYSLARKNLAKWFVPKVWMTEAIPQRGIFEVTYGLEKGIIPSKRARIKCGKRCGWLVETLGDMEEKRGKG